ncbi:DUF3987 domain-containing protein [Acinetobacter seifertii]|uniref:DUF3987 domain-containing protein n=1 Tax=Acinetobacter seifertii TaxID=1530123 RepID=A0A5E9PHV7_9GAMM|nr:DUF3987 domain-containing protein [Acinetobacter seifertii]TEU27179.1 DUF3987 domain-containing protein [Acinetobacter seifertii]
MNLSHLDTHWGEIINLKNDSNIIENPYPHHILPKVVKEACEAASEYVQVPFPLAVHCALGVISHISQGKINAPCNISNSNGMPASLFLVAEGGSGVRKTSCFKLIAKPILDAESKKISDFQRAVRNIKRKKKQNPDLYINDEEMLPTDPTSLFSDITIEKLLNLFIAGELNFASYSTDEASQFFDGFSMKSDSTRANLGALTKLFDSGSCQRNRVTTNDNGTAFNVRLTFNLLGQRAVLQNALLNSTFREQGFLPRFLLVIPESLEGKRIQTTEFRERLKNIENDPRLINFWTRCKKLYDMETKEMLFKVMRLSFSAARVDLDFYNECELLQAKDNIYEYIRPFSSRASEISRRVAANLAFFNGDEEISGEIMKCSCELVRYSLKEWLRYPEIDNSREDDAIKLLKNLIKKAKKMNTNIMLKNFVQKSAPSHLRINSTFDPALQELIDHNYVVKSKLNNKTYITINPSLFK